MKPKKKNILLTGANGYIGKRILPSLINSGYHVICCVRDKKRFSADEKFLESISIIEIDFLKEETLHKIPKNIDAAYYLMHSMTNNRNYEEIESKVAQNFSKVVSLTSVLHVIYLSGIVNENKLSRHLESRKNVERILSNGQFNLTTIRAGIIIGSGSASFEIIRDLVEKLPIMITPKWLKTKCQPISVFDVIQYLTKTLFNSDTFNKNFDIGGKDILSYKDMLLGYAKERGMKRWIIIVPVMTPRLSSYWLYFVTSTSYKLAIALVNSMKVPVVCRDNSLSEILEIKPISYNEALGKTIRTIKNKIIVSSWKDSFISGDIDFNLSEFTKVPEYGCFKDVRKRNVKNIGSTIENIWSIGGEKGWYYANWLWKIRGYMDKFLGGVGLRRGRTHPTIIHPGDAIDFWRVLFTDKKKGHLLLFAEMKVPGEAWLEFKINNGELIQTATFRPKGLNGRLYWYIVYPFHGFVFNGMINKLIKE